MDWVSVVVCCVLKVLVVEGGWNMFLIINVLFDVGDVIGFIGVVVGGEIVWFGWLDVFEIEVLCKKIVQIVDFEE